MGIRGLQRFLHTYPQPLLRDVSISDTNLVIDGSELLYLLYYNMENVYVRCGGEYTEFRKIILSFFAALKHCRIQPYVVFDSFQGVDKVKVYIEKRQKKIFAARSWVEGERADDNVRPHMSTVALIQTLEEEKIPYISFYGDADRQAAALANALDAPVLAADTDFCIFPVNNGFLPLDDFSWKAASCKAESRCHGKIFRADLLLESFRLSSDALSYLQLVLSNNEWLAPEYREEFLQIHTRRVKIPAHLMQKNFRRPNKLENLLVWLSHSCKTDGEMIRKLKQISQNISEERIKKCLENYRVLPDVKKQVSEMQTPGFRGEKSFVPFVSCADMKYPTYCNSVVVDDQEQASSLQISFSLRRAFYEIVIFLKGDDDIDGQKIQEMDRVSDTYQESDLMILRFPESKKEKLDSLRLDLRGGEELQAAAVSSDIVLRRKEYLWEVLGCRDVDSFKDFDRFGEGNVFLAAIITYWYRGAKPPKEVCRALAYTFAFSNAEMTTSDVLEEFMTASTTVFDKNALHSSSQWQSCTRDAIRLNMALGCPVNVPRICKLFSGNLFQQIHGFFRNETRRAEDEMASRCFPGSESAKSHYLALMSLMEDGKE